MKIKLGRFYLELIDDTKPDTRIRRTNGQIARRIPVKEGNKVISYIYL